MKRYITTFFLISLYVTIISNNVYAQLPFEPFTAYTGNPVVHSTPGWDQDAVWWPSVIFVNDTFYMTYIGTNNFPNTAVAIGLATSSDGFSFTKDLNPIIAGDGTGFDAYNASSGVLWYDDPTWYIYYSGRSTPPNITGNVIGRAMSNTSPHGPWTRSNDTLLTVGSPGEWDSEFIGPESIIKNGSELIMYYWAGDLWLDRQKIGMATSTDGGLTWKKYNDPTTTTPPYAESDPVLKPDRPYDNLGIIGCTVLRHDTKWEMVYVGDNTTTPLVICYATSVDGIIWGRDDAHNPIFTPSQDPIATNGFEKPGVVIIGNLYFMYYDYNVTTDGIGLATSNIVSVELLSSNVPNTFSFSQNYPNPFNPGTTIEFALPTPGYVTLSIFNTLGEKVATLVSENLTTGSYKYEWDASELTSGIYFYRLQADSFVETKKMVLMK
jgi:predicted GH43/DUF377 family glycosyl hydrolase